jgi:hypothetical protein
VPHLLPHEAGRPLRSKEGVVNLEAHQDAARSLMTLLAKGDTIHTDQFYGGLARRLVANALLVRGYLESVVEGDRTVLRQQRSLELDDLTWWDEHCGHLQRELDDALAIRERVRAKHVADHDADDRGEREDVRRETEASQDEAARREAPKVAS